MWLMLFENSDKGIARTFAQLGGQPFGYVGYHCIDPPESQGRNRLWSQCVVRRVRAPGDTVQQRLFGSIIERDDQYKFVSYANDL
jgi:hypothetical protein